MKANIVYTYLIFGIILLGSGKVRAQTAIYRPVPEADSTSLVVDILFELAWAYYPLNRVKEHQAQSAYHNMRNIKYSWTDDILAQFNLNEANINPSTTNGVNVYYPRYLFGLRLTLGTFVTIPIQVKKAREAYEASMSETDLQKVLLRSDIARKLEAYKLARKLLKIKTQALEESSTMQQVMKQKFQQSEVSFEDYNSASIAHLHLMESKLMAEAQFNVSKIDLETLVGVKLETIRLPSNF